MRTGGVAAAIAESGSRSVSFAPTVSAQPVVAATAKIASTRARRLAMPSVCWRSTGVRSRRGEWCLRGTVTALTAARPRRLRTFLAAETTPTGAGATASRATTRAARRASSGCMAARANITCVAATASGRLKSSVCWRSRVGCARFAGRLIPNTSITIIAPDGCAGYCASTATAVSGSSGTTLSSSPVRSRI